MTRLFHFLKGRKPIELSPEIPKQIYLSRNGSQEGPFTSKELQLYLESGSISFEDYCWYEGCPEWIPLRQVLPHPAAVDESVIRSHPPTQAATQVRPWIRFYSRSFDYLWFSFAGAFILRMLAPFLIVDYSLWGIIVSFVWCFVEAFFLSVWMTTPGKALLGVSVCKASGSSLGYKTGLSRSLEEWCHGGALGIPIAYFYTYFTCYRSLVKDGDTLWDRAAKSQVRHGKISPFNVSVMIIGYGLGFIWILREPLRLLLKN